MDYLCHLLLMTVIYGLLSVSLDLLLGRVGLVALSQAAFYGLGAYLSSALSVHYQWGFLSATTAAVFVAAIVSVAISLPSVRISGDYFAIATFGVQIILLQAFNNLSSITGGPLG